MSLSDFDKLSVELVPDKMINPQRIQLPQYEVEERQTRLELKNRGNEWYGKGRGTHSESFQS